jgi:uncharacterized protein with PIN domain
MSREVVCPDCDTQLEFYEDDGPFVETLERCDKCERALAEVEYEDARYELDSMYGMGWW